jgi:hypothetical protein
MGSGNKGQSPTAPLSTGTADISQLNQKTQGNNSAWRAPATLSGSGPLVIAMGRPVWELCLVVVRCKTCCLKDYNRPNLAIKEKLD